MSDIKARLDRLRHAMQREEFLEGKGLSKEVNIRFFCYDPADEMAVRWFTEQILTDQSLRCRPIVYNLYDIFLELCDDLGATDEIPEMERSDGRAFLLQELQSACGERYYLEKMRYAPHRPGDVLILTGVGDVFPFMRVHQLLEAMQTEFDDIPVLVLYPGKFDGRQVQLFGKLSPNSYYRAFNEI